ncbi:hypothetical protein [Providencia sp. Je.9.19]|uniref:hypothetical protein n=1 Tax=Providencia sp. Je.9.19 TaxID=3142844 RepID=UPI003DA7EF26
MKAIQVTALKLNGSISFEVYQQGKLLIKDTFSGKSVAEFNKKYNVDCISQEVTVVTTYCDSDTVEISVKVIG